MLTEKQVSEIREHLERAQNPVFFFDNDADGLCAFLLLQRFIGRGKGVPVRSYPDLSLDYLRKINELNADYIFILDKPEVSREFFEEVHKLNIPVVLVDHHEIEKEKIPEFVNYYNPVFNNEKGNEPTTFLCYQVSQKTEDLWIAVIGSISDGFVPDFYTTFMEENPELAKKSENAFEIRYNSQIGKIIHILSFALKDRTTNVINMLRFLMKARSPYDVLQESRENKTMHKRFEQIDKKYRALVEKASKMARNDKKILFFKYSGDLSISSDLSNELMYRFPEKVIVVAYISGVKANISVRGKKIREKVLKVIRDLENASGGGHEDAVGAQVRAEDLDNFKKRLEEIIV
ncbi:MAG: DHHA1 domain-containing protein [archaeon]